MEGHEATRVSVTVGGREMGCVATIGASVIYSDEFRGTADGPYDGLLGDDLLTLYQRCTPLRPAREGEGGGLVANEDYEGVEANVVALLRIVWATARAAGSVGEGWAEFEAGMLASDFVAGELGGAYDAVVSGLGEGAIFRGPSDEGGAGQPDEGQGA